MTHCIHCSKSEYQVDMGELNHSSPHVNVTCPSLSQFLHNASKEKKRKTRWVLTSRWITLLTLTNVWRVETMSSLRGGLSPVCAMLVGLCQAMCMFWTASIAFWMWCTVELQGSSLTWGGRAHPWWCGQCNCSLVLVDRSCLPMWWFYGVGGFPQWAPNPYLPLIPGMLNPQGPWALSDNMCASVQDPWHQDGVNNILGMDVNCCHATIWLTEYHLVSIWDDVQ